MLAPILFLCLASSNISKGQFQKEGFHLLFPFPFATARCKIFYALRRALHHTKDSVAKWILSRSGVAQWIFVAQWISSRSGFRRAVDFVRSGSGFCRAWDVVVHRMLSCIGCSFAEDFIAQWIFLRTGYRSHCENDWFSGQLQDQFLTNWRGILKIPERFLSRTNQIIKTSLIFSKCVMDWEIRRNL
jgi:hypothetical protein